MEDNTSFNHCVVMDQAGHRVGTVSDVVSDATTLEPKWLVVDPGLMRAAHYVPIDGSVRTAQGEIVVPFSKEFVQQTPKALHDHVLSMADESELVAHYGPN